MKAMLDKMKDLLKGRDMCVLATCAEGKPHCSLMGYITDDDATVVYMVTLRETHKYRNLIQNPQASLLVDTRNEQSLRERAGIRALTVSGIFHRIEEEFEKKRILQRLAEQHSHLQELLAREGAEPFGIRINSFLLLDGALDAQFIEV